MENRDRRALEKMYVRATQEYLQQLQEGASHVELGEQKSRILELSRMLDQRGPATDPSASCLRRHQ
ncbi:MAG: hypothetical protein EOP50_05245 [Sphingobacteriales bacterium]|nr:MAG: hypothetical protein EOP50_05245 [Sphingobacteriales bacterium]